MMEFVFKAVWAYPDGKEVFVMYKTIESDRFRAWRNAVNWFHKYHYKSIPFNLRLVRIEIVYEATA